MNPHKTQHRKSGRRDIATGAAGIAIGAALSVGALDTLASKTGFAGIAPSVLGTTMVAADAPDEDCGCGEVSTPGDDGILSTVLAVLDDLAVMVGLANDD